MLTAPVSVKRLDPRAKLPAYGSAAAAGAALYALTDGPVTIAPGQTVLIHTGLALAIPQGYVGLVYARSGLATKQGAEIAIEEINRRLENMEEAVQ